MEEALTRLPAELRLVFLLREAEGLPVLAVARDLGLNPITVRTRLYRARHHLRPPMETRLRGGFDTVFPLGVAPAWPTAWSRCSSGASGGEMRPFGAGPTQECCAGRGCLA